MAGTASLLAAGYGSDGVYRSPRPAAPIPSDPALSLSDLARPPPHLRTRAMDAATGRALTFEALRSAVLATAAALSSRARVHRGNVVLLLAPNCVLYPVCFLAVTAIGAVATTANPLYTPREIAKQIADARVKLIITVSDILPKIADLRLPTILLDGDGAAVPSDHANNVTLYSDLVAGVQETEYRRPPTLQSDTAALFYSSGTTGESKGVVLTHGNFIAAATGATSDQDELGEGRNVFLCFLPMFHIYCMSVVTLAQLQRGKTFVVMARFDVDAVLAAVERHRVTYLFYAPPVMIALAKHGRAGRYDLSSLRCIASGAAPLGKDVMEAVADKCPQAEIIQGYGMTETCGMISLEYPHKGRARQFGSTGTLVTGVEAKIDCRCKDNDASVSESIRRNLCPWTKHNARYFNNVQATEITTKQGWLHTGDLGYFDERGQLYVVDRLKELIKYKVSRLLLLSLKDCFCLMHKFSMPLSSRILILKQGKFPLPMFSLSEVDVQKFIEKQVTYYKRLRKVTFVDSVPKSASGKILRRALIAQVGSSKL
ncbi:LOW QUALITY PROTEIN: hypothetical protein SETIT_9G184000v2 [Setaria italica]|uniref:4-coumarate--CoA ligase n=1 Tax=Setaria italica TaxID=4555 RepID=A0A368SHY1_SETIT|nr:LOW QUALITY PROTEIN: hypothetical protein SETIT_9G184000v2 [Setaria italica]